MTNYLHHVNGTIDVGAGPLPASWGNTSGLNLLDDTALKAKGWLPVTGTAPTPNAHTQKVSGPTGCNVGDQIDPEAESVQCQWTVSLLSDAVVIGKIKTEAQKRILALWGAGNFEHATAKQLNAFARVCELLEILAGGGSLNSGEQTELDSAKALRASTKAIRDYSNTLEAAYVLLTDEQKATFDHTDNSHWSEE